MRTYLVYCYRVSIENAMSVQNDGCFVVAGKRPPRLVMPGKIWLSVAFPALAMEKSKLIA